MLGTELTGQLPFKQVSAPCGAGQEHFGMTAD